MVQKKEKDLRSKKKKLTNCLSLLHFLHSRKLTGRMSFRPRYIKVPLNLKVQKLDPLLTSVLSSSTPNFTTNTHIIENISHDPGTYCNDILTEEKRDIWILKGPEFFQNKNSDFSETFTSFSDVSGKTKTRSLTRNVFTRKLTNGECVERSWLIYSPLKKSVYCYCCRIFNYTITIGNSLSSSNGYKDWKHISNFLMEHENSSLHKQSMMKYPR